MNNHNKRFFRKYLYCRSVFCEHPVCVSYNKSHKYINHKIKDDVQIYINNIAYKYRASLNMYSTAIQRTYLFIKVFTVIIYKHNYIINNIDILYDDYKNRKMYLNNIINYNKLKQLKQCAIIYKEIINNLNYDIIKYIIEPYILEASPVY